MKAHTLPQVHCAYCCFCLNSSCPHSCIVCSPAFFRSLVKYSFSWPNNNYLSLPPFRLYSLSIFPLFFSIIFSVVNCYFYMFLYSFLLKFKLHEGRSLICFIYHWISRDLMQGTVQDTVVPWKSKHSVNICWLNTCVAILSLTDLKKKLFKFSNLNDLSEWRVFKEIFVSLFF